MPRLTKDRALAPDIERIRGLITSGVFSSILASILPGHPLHDEGARHEQPCDSSACAHRHDDRRHGMSRMAGSICRRPAAADPPAQDLQIEVTKKGLGKEVSLKHGPKEWFMLVEVTPENTVVISSGKRGMRRILVEVNKAKTSHWLVDVGPKFDTIIDDFINRSKPKQSPNVNNLLIGLLTDMRIARFARRILSFFSPRL